MFPVYYTPFHAIKNNFFPPIFSLLSGLASPKNYLHWRFRRVLVLRSGRSLIYPPARFFKPIFFALFTLL